MSVNFLNLNILQKNIERVNITINLLTRFSLL